MTQIETPTLPAVYQDDDGGSYWCEGHVDRREFLLACVVDMVISTGNAEDVRCLLAFMDIPHDTEIALNRAALRLREVEHAWCKFDPDDDERMIKCEANEYGALACTRISL